MMNFFKNKVVVLTGASSGIGLASARRFANAGANLVIAARSKDKLEALKIELSPYSNIVVVPTDVSIEDDCKRLIKTAVGAFGTIDILVNNAGVSMRAMLKDLDLSVIKRSMDVNFWGTVYCTKYALPYLLKSKGSVVGVVSVAGFKGLPARTGYSSSKFAICGFLDALRVEHLYDGLHVLIFAPGFTASNIRSTAMTADGSPQGSSPRDEKKMMTADRCAWFLLNGIKRRKSKVVLTLVGRTTVFLNKFFPSLLDKLEYMYMAKEPNSPFKTNQ
jgi:short-subunit dehydrogenase